MSCLHHAIENTYEIFVRCSQITLRRKREVSLVELIDQGEQEDVDLLFNCLESKGVMSSFQVVLPERYSSEQRTRCHEWLRDMLEFEEECKGNIVVYKHKTRKVMINSTLGNATLFVC